ncbi:MAG TPA: DUF3427 domain-containing protein [Thermoanaerobaculia bacterium]|nr:DUF3427 domain-containing protein [Thermoanaerobaculia bacterium]
MTCPFCDIIDEAAIFTTPEFFAIWDAFPASPGHALVIPRRHVASWFEATPDERSALSEATDKVQQEITRLYAPHGFNVGINVGETAGQTIFHLHVHVIPRYRGDVPDPRGGVRAVIPAKQRYAGISSSLIVSPSQRLFRGGDGDPLFPELVAHIAEAKALDIAVAFTLTRGVELLYPHLEDLLARGGHIRFLTGDYRDATEPEALWRLLDLRGSIDLRVFESSFLRSFHPKSYVLRSDDEHGVAFVGSSNISESALRRGIEWNYRVTSSEEPQGFAEVRQAFEQLFQSQDTVPLTQEWIESYERRRRIAELVMPDLVREVAPEPYGATTPHEVQREALAALDATRIEGNKAGLVVLATGLGKTWLSAFDTARPEFRRVLFVAHREEILNQAMRTFRHVRSNARLGLYNGTSRDPGAEVVFASVQTLGRAEHLARFDPTEFDYLVIDEFHHASAPTYRKIINHFQPRFLLGLTATPERSDGGNLLALCHENLVYRCDLSEGIRRGLLSPFHYFGVPDDVDYANIPWRNNRFDEEELTNALATQRRAENILEQWRSRGGSKTIAFCVSQRHADFTADYFVLNGVRAVAVHSGPRSAPRTISLERLAAGELDIVCAVDMFNEGVDVPEIDTVMMLRPTQSKILWLQQLGRGLRKTDDKPHLNVIDYIGNHRTFLLKPQTLFDLSPGRPEILNFLERYQNAELELPPGCEVTYDLETIDILRKLAQSGRGDLDALRRYYEDFRELHGVRPSASEAYHDSYNPRSARKDYKSWVGFVRAMKDLDADSKVALDDHSDFLTSLETTPISNSFKMIVLLAMLNLDRFPGEVGIDELGAEVRRIADASAALRSQFGEALSDPTRMRQLLETNPVNAWTGGRGTGNKQYFAYKNGSFRTTLVVAEPRAGLQELVREVVEWRLAEHLNRAEPQDGITDRFVMKVSHVDGRPRLSLPDRDANPELPRGSTPVNVGDISYLFDFEDLAVTVARRTEGGQNELVDLLRKWFGADVGFAGTRATVLFTSKDGGWHAAPEGQRQGELQLWRSYSRELIPPLFGMEFSTAIWNVGYVARSGHVILLVTLEKGEHAENFQYGDRFLSPKLFEWQSQNRTAADGKDGRLIREHSPGGVPVHLFVRRSKKIGSRSAPFIFCGDVTFVDFTGTAPMTVRWSLPEPVPDRMRAALSVPADIGGR